jgi:hypothetical protein
VASDGLLAEEQDRRDTPISVPLRYQGEHLTLPGS